MGQRGNSHRNHVKLHEESAIPHLCNQCGSTFSTEFAFRNHRKIHNFEVAMRHRKKKEKKEKKVSNFSALCNVCGKNFTQKTGYSYHIRTAHLEADELLKCPHCPQTYPTQPQMDSHVKLHFPPTHQCPYCTKLFHTKAYLKIHNKAVHMPDNMKDFVCEECGKGFNNKDNYEGHLNMHAGLKPFRCRYC